MPEANVVKLAHLSDIHIAVPTVRWRGRDWLSKRVTGWIHYQWNRRQRFLGSEATLKALMDDIAEQRPDAVVFSGDATALGFPAELERAAELLRIGNRAGLAIPGNHDYYTLRDEWSGGFERVFTPWQAGERIAARTYPFAQKVGHVWLIGVNACRGHILPWEASGRVDPEQLARLDQLLARLEPGPRILVVHYPAAKADGTREGATHGLHDADALFEIIRRHGVGLWLHGHRHDPYFLNDARLAPCPLICVGSSTEVGRAGYHEYTIQGNHLQAVRRVYDPSTGRCQDGLRFDLTLGLSDPPA